MILCLVLGTALTVVAALIPALRATRVPPVTGLREGAVVATPARERRLRTVAAIALTRSASPGCCWGCSARSTRRGLVGVGRRRSSASRC